MASVVWTSEATFELDEIRRFIWRGSPEAAENFRSRVLAAADRLEHFPLSGRQVPEDTSGLLREVIVGSYRVIYSVIDDVVFVFTIQPGSRPLRGRRRLAEE